MRIVVVTDGGARMGMGHVHQSLTLCRKLRCGADVRFLTKSDQLVVRTIAEAGFPVDAVADDVQIFSVLRSEDPDVVLFDKIDVNVELAKKIRTSLRARLVIFTNLTAANDYAHMVVLPRAANVKVDVASRFENFSYQDAATNTVYFYGPTYWVLRPEFHQYGALEKARIRPIQRLLLTFGGSDPSDLTALVLKELLRMEQSFSIDVIAGSHYTGLESLERLLRSQPPGAKSVTLHRNVSNVGELMHNADLAITAAGMSMFEALCVKTPVIVIPQDELQRETYEGVMRLLHRDQVGELADVIARRDFTDPRDPFIEGMRIGEGLGLLTDCILERQAAARRGAGTLVADQPSCGKTSS